MKERKYSQTMPYHKAKDTLSLLHSFKCLLTDTNWSTVNMRSEISTPIPCEDMLLQ